MRPKTILGALLCLIVLSFSTRLAEAKFTLGAGFLYVFQQGNSDKNLDSGPGVHANVGFEGKIFGVRGDFFYAALEREDKLSDPKLNDADIYGGTVDFKVRPIGMIEFPLQPYCLLGFGGQGGGAAGALGNVGVGLELALGDHFSLGIEGNWKPLIYPGDDFFEDSFDHGDDDLAVMNFYTASANAAFHF